MKASYYPVFVYGTLKDEDICRLLFEENIGSDIATLDNYAIKKNSNFFYLSYNENSWVQGKVIYLNERQLLIADQWEEIPFYSRKQVDVSVNQNKTTAWVYMRENIDGQEADLDDVSGFGRDELLNLVHQFNKERKHSKLPYTDAYFLIPCTIQPSNRKFYNNEAVFEKYFINKIANISKSEFRGILGNKINRFSLSQIEIAAYSCNDEDILGYQKASVLISEFDNTGFATLNIIVPAVSIPLLYLLDQASSDRLKVREIDSKIFVPIEDYFITKGILLSGTIRSALFMQEKPLESDFISILICEAESQSKITSKKILDEININVGQYSTAEIYASDVCLIEVSNRFDSLYENRLNGQLLTLFILELIQLQESALKKVSSAFFNMISSKAYISDSVALKQVEEITEEYSKAMLLWNIYNFKYTTAQSLADELSSKFKMNKRFDEFLQYKNVIEQLTSIHSNRINIKESRILNKVLLVLAFIQIVPILNNIFQSIVKNNFEITDIFTSLTSVISCYMIWLIFRFINKKA